MTLNFFSRVSYSGYYTALPWQKQGFDSPYPLQIVITIWSEARLASRRNGPSLPGRINEGSVEYMEREGISSLEEIRGADAI